MFYERKPHNIGRITWSISSDQASMTLPIYIVYVWFKNPKKWFSELTKCDKTLILTRDWLWTKSDNFVNKNPLLRHDVSFVNVMLYEIDERYIGPVVALLMGWIIVDTLYIDLALYIGISLYWTLCDYVPCICLPRLCNLESRNSSRSDHMRRFWLLGEWFGARVVSR